MELSENARKILEDRYLFRDANGRVKETPDEMLHRVARTVAEAEKNYRDGDASKWEATFFRMMDSCEFLPNSPTLMNAGSPLGQLSACFVLPVPDSLEGIFHAVRDMALV